MRLIILHLGPVLPNILPYPTGQFTELGFTMDGFPWIPVVFCLEVLLLVPDVDCESHGLTHEVWIQKNAITHFTSSKLPKENSGGLCNIMAWGGEVASPCSLLVWLGERLWCPLGNAKVICLARPATFPRESGSLPDLLEFSHFSGLDFSGKQQVWTLWPIHSESE